MNMQTPAAGAGSTAAQNTSTAAAMAAAPAPAAAAAPASGTPAAAAPSTSWTEGFNEDLKGYVGLKGFKDPAAVVDAYRQFEKMQGVPQDRIMKLPEQFYDDKGALTAEGRAIRERLGAPKTPADYGIEAPKEGGDPKLMEHFTKLFHDLGIPKTDAQKIVEGWNGYNGQAAKMVQEIKAQEFNNQRQALQKEWGAAYDQNKNIAADGMRKMGMDAAKVDALSAVLGHAETMKLLCNIGKSTGEASFVVGRNPNAPMEPATARSRINELLADKDFGNRLMNGESDAKATWERLHQQAYQGSVNI